MQSGCLSFNKRHRKPLVERSHYKNIHCAEYAIDISAYTRKYHTVSKSERLHLFLYRSAQIAVSDKKQNGIAVLLFNLGKNIDKKIMVLLNMKTRDIAYNKFSVKSEFRPDFIALIRRESKFIRIDTVSDNIVVAALCCFLAVHPYTGIV